MTRSVKLVVCTLALALLAACGAEQAPAAGTTAPANGDTPAGSSDSAPSSTSGGAPVFPGAKPVDDSSPMAMGINMMKDTMKQQAAGNATFDAYVLPSGTTFDKVKEFYNTELTKDGWQAAGASNPTAEVWLKNSGAESFTVSSIPDPSQTVILVMQTKP